MDGTTPESTRTVETTISVDIDPAAVIAAFLDDEALGGWWKTTRTLVDPRVGGVWAIAWDRYGDEATNHSWAGVIAELDDRRLVIDPLVQNEPDRPLFGPLAIEIVAQPAAAGTRLTVRHHGYRRGEHWDWLHDAVVRGWADVLKDFKSWAAEG